MKREAADRLANASLQSYIDGISSNISAGYWLGLENLHQLTKYLPHKMRIELTDTSGLTKVADYTAVRVSSIIISNLTFDSFCACVEVIKNQNLLIIFKEYHFY